MYLLGADSKEAKYVSGWEPDMNQSLQMFPGAKQKKILVHTANPSSLIIGILALDAEEKLPNPTS
jgi:hypothetical protein